MLEIKKTRDLRNRCGASGLPSLTDELLRRGYSEEDARKILKEDVLRVMKDVDKA